MLHKPVTESRVMTGENIITQLKDREAAGKQKRGDIIKRKAEREQKKTQQKLEKAERKRKREEKRQEKMNLIKQRRVM